MKQNITMSSDLFKTILPVIKRRVEDRLRQELSDIFEKIIQEELATVILDVGSYIDAKESEPVMIVSLRYEPKTKAS